MNNIYRWRPRRQIDIDERIASLMPSGWRKEPLSTQPKEPNTGTMKCSRCFQRTHSLSYKVGNTDKDGVCPTCAIITGVSIEELPPVVTQVLQLIDAGLKDLPAIIDELHARVCRADISDGMQRETLVRVARWKKGFNN